MFLKKPDARLENWLRGFPASALLSVFSKWYSTVLVDLLHEEREPIEWLSLHVGAEVVDCEHMQSLLTNLLQKHWEWQEHRREDLEHGKFKYKTVYTACLDVKTAFDVAKPSVVSKIPPLIGTHGHVVAASLAQMQDVKGSACFENCETEFRYSKCMRQRGVEAPVLWGRVANYVHWKAEERWKARGGDCRLGGRGGVSDNEHT